MPPLREVGEAIFIIIMEIKDWLGIVVQVVIAIATLVGAWPLLKRVPSQNAKDNMDAVKVALEIAGIDAEEQLELKREVKKLQDMLEKRRYKISVVFRLGETPIVEEASIESYEVAVI